MFNNRPHFSLVKNVVNSKKKNIYQFEFFHTMNKYDVSNLKFEYNLKFKLFLITRMTTVFKYNFQPRKYFSFKLNHTIKPSISSVNASRRSSTNKVISLDQFNYENENDKLLNPDSDFISDYLYEKSAIKLSVKLLKENFKSNSEWFVKIIKCEGEMNKTAVENILQNFTFLRKKIKWKEKDQEEVRNSKEVTDFLKALHLHVSEISSISLIQALSFFVTFGFPLDHDVVILIISRLIEEVNSLTFCEGIFLYRLLSFYNHIDLVDELRLNLKNKTKKQVIEESKNFSTEELIQALKYASSNSANLPDEDKILLYTLALNADDNIWNNRSGFTSCFKLIHKLNSGDINVYREKFFKKFYNYTLQNCQENNNSRNLCDFALNYAFCVQFNSEPYDAEFFDHVIDSTLRRKLSLFEWQTILFSMEILGHINFDVIAKIKFLFAERPLLALQSDYLLKNMIILLIDSNCARKQSSSLHFQKFLENLLNLKDLSFWSTKDLNLSLRIVTSLASVGIFSDNVLNYLARKSSEINFDERKCVPYLYIALNQAVTVFHPSYPKPFLKEEILSSALASLIYPSTPEHLRFFTDSVKKVLESTLPDKNCFSMDRRSKLGHKINFLIAVNKEGKYFNFPSIVELGKKSCIEDIFLPSGYKLVLVLMISKGHYTRNLFSLRTVARIRVNTLEKMGYSTINILHEKWLNFTFDQQKAFIKLKLNKIIYRLSKSSLEKT